MKEIGVPGKWKRR